MQNPVTVALLPVSDAESKNCSTIMVILDGHHRARFFRKIFPKETLLPVHLDLATEAKRQSELKYLARLERQVVASMLAFSRQLECKGKMKTYSSIPFLAEHVIRMISQENPILNDLGLYYLSVSQATA